MDSLFIPIHINSSHWTAILVHFQEKMVTKLNSMGNAGYNHVNNILCYLNDQHLTMFHTPLPRGPSGWKHKMPPDDPPLQTNSYDCGVYVCFFANRAYQHCPYHATPADITHFREHIGVSIVSNTGMD
jgi:sentrin-specific protease 1